METNTVSQPFTSNSTSAASNGQTAEEATSDYDTFINMLTVQLQNQDPLNPTEATDFAVQLATFSTVEQLVLTNDLLTDLASQVGTLGASQISSWLGMEARVEIPVQFQGDPVKLTLRTEETADAAQLIVRNNQGDEIQRLDVSPEGGEFVWTGTDSFGNPLPDGTYTISTESFVEGDVIATKPVEVHERIVEMRNYDGESRLILASGEEVSSDQVLGLLQP